MTTSLLLAQICLVVVLATFLPLFLGIARARRLLATVLVVATAALFVASAVALQDLGDLGDMVSGRAGLLAGAAAAVVVLVAVLTYLAWRWPCWAMPVMVAVMPIRLPVPLGDRDAYLLVPLYLTVLAVLIAEVVVRDRLRPPAAAGPAEAGGGLLRARDPLRLALAAFVALAGMSVFWAGLTYGPEVLGASWRQEAYAGVLVELLAFYLPFALVLTLTYRYIADGAALRRLLLTVLGSAVVMAVIAVVQFPTHWLIFNRGRLLEDFAEGKGFRVNALFWDPNMLSRFLIVALILSVVLMVAVPLWRRPLIATAFLLAGANLLTLSRSGWLALAAGLVVFGFAWLGRRRGVYTAGAAVLVLIAAGGLLVAARGVSVTRAKISKPWGINHMTGGRLYLAEAALKMTADHPVQGVGLGGFSAAYPQYRNRHAYKKLTESHTTPLTVMAELGIPGLLIYVWVLVAAFWLSFRRRSLAAAPGVTLAGTPPRAGPGVASLAPSNAIGGPVVVNAAATAAGAVVPAASPGPREAVSSAGRGEAAGRPSDGDDRRRADGDDEDDARRLFLVRAGFGSILAALVTHSLLYNAFFEDPYVWLVSGLVLAAAYRLSGWRPRGR
jgi:O-antigen ligase